MTLPYQFTDLCTASLSAVRELARMAGAVIAFIQGNRFDDFMVEVTLRLRQENQKRIAEIKDAEKAENDAREQAEMQRKIDEMDDRYYT